MNRIHRMDDGRYIVNGVEVSKRVFIEAANQNERLYAASIRMRDVRYIRPWNRIKLRERSEAMRSKKAPAPGYEYSIGVAVGGLSEALRCSRGNLEQLLTPLQTFTIEYVDRIETHVVKPNGETQWLNTIFKRFPTT